jgi:5-methylcytosine-specific restriction endonuclease McrA
MKKCTECQVEKLENEFYLRCGSLLPHCKACHRARNKRYWANRTEKQRQKQREWARANPPKRSKSYYKRRVAYHRRFYAARPFKRLAKAINKKSQFGLISAVELRRIAKKQKCLCALSGRKLTANNISPDHIIPLAKGGNNSAQNIQLVTKEANLAKHILSKEELLSLCRDVVAHLERNIAK